MYQVSSEQHRSLISAILRTAVRPPKSLRGVDWRRYLHTYFAHVDMSDLADRGAARQDPAGAGIQPHVARARFRLAAYDHRSHQR
jgi:hypothetical protein